MIEGGSLSSTSTPALSNVTAATLCVVPSGPSVVVLSNNSGATVYIAAGVTATTSNGFAIPTGGPPVQITTLPGSTGTTLSVIAGTAPGASLPVSWLISTAQ